MSTQPTAIIYAVTGKLMLKYIGEIIASAKTRDDYLTRLKAEYIQETLYNAMVREVEVQPVPQPMQPVQPEAAADADVEAG